MAKAKQNIASRVAALIEDTVLAQGCELWDVVYVKDGAFCYLRITIDAPEGIDLERCERVHRAIEPIIDREDPIEDQYFLEVSSPGLERELRTEAHLARFMGSVVTVKLFSAVDGSKQYIGALDAADEHTVTLKTEQGERVLDRKNVSKINLYYDFDAEEQTGG